MSHQEINTFRAFDRIQELKSRKRPNDKSRPLVLSADYNPENTPVGQAIAEPERAVAERRARAVAVASSSDDDAAPVGLQPDQPDGIQFAPGLSLQPPPGLDREQIESERMDDGAWPDAGADEEEAPDPVERRARLVDEIRALDIQAGSAASEDDAFLSSHNVYAYQEEKAYASWYGHDGNGFQRFAFLFELMFLPLDQ